MADECWKPEYTERAERFWAVYQVAHDVSDRTGQAVGIDPVTGKVWFGESMLDIMSQQEIAKEEAPLFYSRVGRRAYGRKGRRR